MNNRVYEDIDVNDKVVVEDHVVKDAEGDQVGFYDVDVDEITQVLDLDVLQVDDALKVHCH